MKLEYVVSRIEASQDGSPYVYVTYTNPNPDFKAGAERPTNPLTSVSKLRRVKAKKQFS